MLYAATILMALPLAIGSSLVSPMVDHTYKAGLGVLEFNLAALQRSFRARVV